MNNLKILTLTVLASVLAFASCKDDDDELLTVNVQTVTNKVVEDTWEVASFINGDDGNETALYAGYVFQFFSNGTVEARYNNVTETGTWNVQVDDGRTELYIEFDGSTNDALLNLDEDWHVTELDVNTLKAQDLDDEFLDTDDEFLELQKVL